MRQDASTNTRTHRRKYPEKPAVATTPSPNFAPEKVDVNLFRNTTPQFAVLGVDILSIMLSISKT
jgi:hypothetical protein